MDYKVRVDYEVTLQVEAGNPSDEMLEKAASTCTDMSVVGELEGSLYWEVKYEWWNPEPDHPWTCQVSYQVDEGIPSVQKV